MSGPTLQPTLPPNLPRQLVKRALAAALPRRALLVRGPERSGAVCLTFDDGPHPDHTPPLLEALDRLHARATFFLVGARAAAHPELVRAIAARGHAIGHHSYGHGDPRRIGAGPLAREAALTALLLADITGRAPTLFRPPHGKLTPGKLVRLWLLRNAVVLWSLDPKDFASRSAQETLRFFEDHAPRAGDVVLLHDNHPRAAEIALGLVPLIRARGLDLATVDAWCR